MSFSAYIYAILYLKRLLNARAMMQAVRYFFDLLVAALFDIGESAGWY